MFRTRQSTARKTISRRLRTGLALAAAAGAIAGVSASSAMAATSLGCLQYPAGQLCADDDVGYDGYVLATAYFSDGSQLSLYMGSDTWNVLVDASSTASAPSDAPYGLANLDYVLNHPPSAGSAGGGGGGVSVADLSSHVLTSAGTIGEISPAGTTLVYNPETGMTGTLFDGNLTPTP
jgi:hypothetical protein